MESGCLPVWYKGSVCEVDDALSRPAFLLFSLSAQTLGQQTVSQQVGAALTLHLLHTFSPLLVYSSVTLQLPFV